MISTWQSRITGKIFWQLEKAVRWLTSRPVVRSVQLVLRGSLILLKVAAFLIGLFVFTLGAMLTQQLPGSLMPWIVMPLPFVVWKVRWLIKAIDVFFAILGWLVEVAVCLFREAYGLIYWRNWTAALCWLIFCLHRSTPSFVVLLIAWGLSPRVRLFVNSLLEKVGLHLGPYDCHCHCWRCRC